MLRNICIDRNLKKRIFGELVQNQEIFLLKNKNFTSYKKILKNVFFDKKSIIPKMLVGERIFFHNGKEILSIKVALNMVGYKLGEFFFNKKSFANKKTKVIKKG